jgi:hypothetical protein
MKYHNKTVIVVVPNVPLRVQMENQLGRLCRGMTILTRAEQLQQLPPADLLIVDEVDETVLELPYEFLPNSET